MKRRALNRRSQQRNAAMGKFFLTGSTRITILPVVDISWYPNVQNTHPSPICFMEKSKDHSKML
jgi:hypothetical protein